MKFARVGTRHINELSYSSLWTEQLPGVSLGNLVTIVEDSGQESIGRIVAIENGRCQIRLADENGTISRENVSVWAGSREIELPLSPAYKLSTSSNVPFRTGIGAVDSLFPIQKGQSILLKGWSWNGSMSFLSNLIQSAVESGQSVQILVLDASQSEENDIRMLLEKQGLSLDCLSISNCGHPLYQSLSPVQSGFHQAFVQADDGKDVFLLVLELQSWFRLFQEDLVLRGLFHTQRGSVTAFRSELSRCLDLLLNHVGIVTSAIFWSEQISGTAGISPLFPVKDLFDGFFVIENDGSLAMEGFTPPMPDCHGADFAYAHLLRSQIKESLQTILRKEHSGDPLSSLERCFCEKIHDFLCTLQVGKKTVSEEIWQIIGMLPESKLSRIPISLLRGFCHRPSAEDD